MFPATNDRLLRVCLENRQTVRACVVQLDAAQRGAAAAASDQCGIGPVQPVCVRLSRMRWLVRLCLFSPDCVCAPIVDFIILFIILNDVFQAKNLNEASESQSCKKPASTCDN